MYFVLNMIDYFVHVSHSLVEFFFIFIAEAREDLAPQFAGETHNEIAWFA